MQHDSSSIEFCMRTKGRLQSVPCFAPVVSNKRGSRFSVSLFLWCCSVSDKTQKYVYSGVDIALDSLYAACKSPPGISTWPAHYCTSNALLCTSCQTKDVSVCVVSLSQPCLSQMTLSTLCVQSCGHRPIWQEKLRAIGK